MDEPLPELLPAVQALSPQDVPAALGVLERAKAVLWARLYAPKPHEANDGATRPTDERLLTPTEAAERLRVSTRTIYRLSDKLGGQKVGHTLRFSEDGLRRYLARRR
jgi:excisionase family DNA binding protein